MSTESEVKLARYSQKEKEVDKFDRIIVVRRLKPSERLKVSGMAADNFSGGDKIKNAEGEDYEVPHVLGLIVAASVCQIDEMHIPFPRNIGELMAIYDRLDIEGIEAAGKAMMRLMATETVIDAEVESKNWSGTPSSA